MGIENKVILVEQGKVGKWLIEIAETLKIVE